MTSDTPVRGLLVASPGGGEAIAIRRHPAIPPPHIEGPEWAGGVDALTLSAPGVAHYRCTARSIDVTPIAGAEEEAIEALLIATALPALLWMEGAFLLHAAAVTTCGEAGALAIAGVSGSGKSRLAAALVARSAALVADDSVALRFDAEGGPVASGLPGGYHLGGAAVRPFHCLPPRRGCRAASLAAVVVLGDETGRLTGADAVAALLAHRHRPSVPRRLGLEGRGLADAARVARAVPVYRWSSADADALLDDAIRGAVIRGEKR